MVLLGMTIFSALKFKPLVSFPRFIAGGRGDFENFGEMGGVKEVLVLGLVAEVGGVGGGGDIFFSELRPSRLGTRLQVG